MKYNLTTFPFKEDGCDCCEAFHNWKDGFEKDLRSIVAGHCCKELIKEILGE